jgi:hypothetical protein
MEAATERALIREVETPGLVLQRIHPQRASWIRLCLAFIFNPHPPEDAITMPAKSVIAVVMVSLRRCANMLCGMRICWSL